MAMLTVEGVYRDGRVELTELPQDQPAEGRVLVTFLPASEVPEVSESEDTREALRRRAFARMERGLDLGGPLYAGREELHDRGRRTEVEGVRCVNPFAGP